jgi:hypothetical protein
MEATYSLRGVSCWCTDTASQHACGPDVPAETIEKHCRHFRVRGSGRSGGACEARRGNVARFCVGLTLV